MKKVFTAGFLQNRQVRFWAAAAAFFALFTVFPGLFDRLKLRSQPPEIVVLSEKLLAVPTLGNMQGLTYADGNYYFSFDTGKDTGRILVCSSDGRLLKKTGALPIGHAPELAYREKDGRLYLARRSGPGKVEILSVSIGRRKTKVYEPLRLNLSGYGGLLAIDNDRDRMIVSTNSVRLKCATPDAPVNLHSHVTFYALSFSGYPLGRFTLCYQGIPQGIECRGSLIYFYTNNKITVLSPAGKIIKQYYFSRPGESEGMTFVSLHGRSEMAVGYKYPCEVYLLKVLHL